MASITFRDRRGPDGEIDANTADTVGPFYSVEVTAAFVIAGGEIIAQVWPGGWRRVATGRVWTRFVVEG